MANKKGFIGVGKAVDLAYVLDFKVVSGTDQPAVVGTMSAKSPENDAEAGYLRILVNGTEYQIPFYAAA